MSLPPVTTAAYRLDVSADGWATVAAPDGTPWVKLALVAAFDTRERPDETLELLEPSICAEGAVTTVAVGRRSTHWDEASVIVECRADAIVVRAEVRGRGRLDTVSMLGGRSLMPNCLGFLHSGSELPTLFSPNPEDPRHVLRSAGKPAVIGVTGDSLPGRGHWFFTPAPFFFALTDGTDRDVDVGRPRGWLGLGLVAGATELDCTQLAYVPADEGFHLELDYQGHRLVEGKFEAPSVLVLPGAPDPYTGLERYRRELVQAGHVPRQRGAAAGRPSWWSRPMFCGWGAQCYLASLSGTRPSEQCSAANYDRFLAELSGHGLVPATIVIDDGWQSQYGRVAPHPGRWPDLRGWIGERHRAGQRVLLWWKAWDPEGVPAELCITNPDGLPVAIDPGRAQTFTSENIGGLLGPSGLDADGLKVDFTARTPSGYGLGRPGRADGGWGIALLHEHLAQIYDAVKLAKADALVITHAANPGFVDVGDMVRLNDMLRLDEANPDSPLVTQMRYRSAVVRAACPELLIDTDDWCAPNLAQWREYLAVKASLGVPALYYTTHLDRTGEALEEQDYAALRALWASAGYEPSDARKDQQP